MFLLSQHLNILIKRIGIHGVVTTKNVENKRNINQGELRWQFIFKDLGYAIFLDSNY